MSWAAVQRPANRAAEIANALRMLASIAGSRGWRSGTDTKVVRPGGAAIRRGPWPTWSDGNGPCGHLESCGRSALHDDQRSGLRAVLGSSRPLSVTTTSTPAILTAAALHQAVPGGDPVELTAAAATLACL